MLKKIAIALVCLVAGFLGFAATKPDTFRIQRTASIHAAPDEIFVHINDFHRWGGWSPYEKKDASMKRTYSGAAYGFIALSVRSRRSVGP